MKKIKEEQDALDQRFNATHKSIDHNKEMMAEEIKKFKNFILKDFGRINDQCKLDLSSWSFKVVIVYQTYRHVNPRKHQHIKC